jgi:hypothetical protein
MSSRSPHASCLSTFRAPGRGTPETLPSCRRRNATSWKLVPFSHRSTSRIFIRQPDCIPSPVVTQDGDPQLLDGEKQVGLRSWFRPQLRGCPSSLLGRRALTSPASGADFDSVGLVDGGCRQLQRVGLAGLAPGAPPAARVVAAPCARVDRPRHRAPLERRSCSRAVLPLQRYGASARRSVLRSSGRIRVGICRWADAPLEGAEVDAAREVPVADGITATIRALGLRLFVLVLAPRASARARARLQRLPPWGHRCCRGDGTGVPFVLAP